MFAILASSDWPLPLEENGGGTIEGPHGPTEPPRFDADPVRARVQDWPWHAAEATEGSKSAGREELMVGRVPTF